MNTLTKTKTVEWTILLYCNSCQEEVNLHKCEKCHQPFQDNEPIYCQTKSRMDSEHYHEKCKPTNTKKNLKRGHGKDGRLKCNDARCKICG